MLRIDDIIKVALDKDDFSSFFVSSDDVVLSSLPISSFSSSFSSSFLLSVVSQSAPVNKRVDKLNGSVTLTLSGSSKSNTTTNYYYMVHNQLFVFHIHR